MSTTPKGAATRQRILDAAWELSDAQGAESVLGGVTLREIATAVDMVPSAVAYHFPTNRDLCIAMVEHLADSLSPVSVEAVDQLLDGLSGQGLVAAARAAAEATWGIITTDDELRITRRLLRCQAVSVQDPTVRAAISQALRTWVNDLTLVFSRAGERLGMSPMEPLELEEIALAVSSMGTGMLQHWMCDPDAVRDDLMADMVMAITSSMIVPTERSTDLAELRGLHSPSADGPTPEELAELAGLVAEESLFGEGLEQVSITGIARSLGQPVQQVASLYGSVDRIAALSFLRHHPQVLAASTRRSDAGPRVSLTDAVYELARCAQADRHCAVALLNERTRAALTGTPGCIDPRSAVPLDDIFAAPLAQLAGTTPGRRQELASMLVDTVLLQGANRPRASVSSVTEVALRLVPEF